MSIERTITEFFVKDAVRLLWLFDEIFFVKEDEKKRPALVW